MNPNVWNIKEILSIPPVSGWTGSTGDGSSLTDSQFLYGSQLCPDPSQSFSQDITVPSRISLQGSQEARESSFSTNYHSKPYLFGGDSQDNGKVLIATCDKNKGILEKFEEEKRKSRGKEESEILRDRMLQLGDCIENMKIALDGIEGAVESTTSAMLQRLEAFAKSMQESLARIKDNMTSQLEAILHKLDCDAETLQEMKGRDVKMHVDMSALQSCVQGLNQDLQALKTEHNKEQGMIGDMLLLLQGLISSQKLTVRKADRIVQTSPCHPEMLPLTGEEPRHFEGLRMYSGPVALCKGKGGCSEQPDDIETNVGNYSVNMLMAVAAQDSKQRLYSTRTATRVGSANMDTPAHTLHENSLPNGGELAKCPQAPNSQKRGTSQQTACTTGRGLKNPSTCRPASVKRLRARSAKRGSAQMLQMDKSRPLLKNRVEGRALQESILQDLTGYVKATPTFNTSNVHHQRKSLWQLFNIIDDSD